VSAFPELEQALDAAAHRHYGAARRRRRRLLVPALACAAAAAFALTLLPARATRPAQAPPAVPAQTLALSHALATAPDLPPLTAREPVLAPASLPFVADGLEKRTPYPPGRRDPFNWRSITPGRGHMAGLVHARDVQGLVELRAACIWLRYLIASEGARRAAAAAVLEGVPRWPTLRDHPGGWADLPLADRAAVDAQLSGACHPWG
jgi:hypothetical protein